MKNIKLKITSKSVIFLLFAICFFSIPTPIYLFRKYNQNLSPSTLLSRRDILGWWKQHPTAPLGISCNSSLKVVDQNENEHSKNSVVIPYPIFHHRVPNAKEDPLVQVALVIPCFKSKLDFVAAKMLTFHWKEYSPCISGSEKMDVDLFFYVDEDHVNDEMKTLILEKYLALGEDKIGCFRNSEPTFLFIEKDVNENFSDWTEREKDAFAFYSLFARLEINYKTMMVMEPDLVPVKSNFVHAIVENSKSLSCEPDGIWQINPIYYTEKTIFKNPSVRLNISVNKNSIYVLGCPDFEDYKCRVQTYYLPSNECKHVAGCSPHDQYQTGYEYALHQFRFQPENQIYSSAVNDKFQYSAIIQSVGGANNYTPQEIMQTSTMTYFVHGRRPFKTEAAENMEEIALRLGLNICDHEMFKKLYRYLRTSEFTKEDAIRYVCMNFKPELTNSKICDLPNMQKEIEWKDRMKDRTFFWTMDFHGGPINCDIPVIQEAGGSVHAEIAGMCDFFGLCPERLKVIKANNWHEYEPTEEQIRQFQLQYKDDPEFDRVDAFICHHPVANCELLVPFNKTIIIHASTRLEFGRHDAGIDWRLGSGYEEKIGKKKWKEWMDTIRALSRDEKNIIAANSAYDREYIKYFTGIKDVQLIPSWCGDNVGTKLCEPNWDLSYNQKWEPTRSEVMLVPYRSNLERTRFELNIREPHDHPIIVDMMSVSAEISNGTSVKMIGDLYDSSNPLQMVHHSAIIIIPYQISTINLIELYRLNIPTFCPSISLLKEWCREHDLMWETHYGWPERLTTDDSEFVFEDIPDPNPKMDMDKNSIEWERSLDYWLPLADFYQNEVGMVYFDSWEDFFVKYNNLKYNGGLRQMHNDMKKVNKDLRKQLILRWKGIIAHIQEHK